jgi:histone chaperone ASF1
VRVGYYVNNEYSDEALAADPPAKPVLEKIRRNILAEKPRVTRFAIKWDSEESAPAEFPPEQPDVDAQEDDEAKYGADEEEEEEVDGEEEAPELVETEEGAKKEEDHEMDGMDEEVDDNASEDLEAESEEDDEEEDEEAEEEANGDAMEMDPKPEPVAA